MSNPTKFSWVDPTINVDGSAIVAGEITGYSIGVRSTSAAAGGAGTYPIVGTVTGAAAATDLISALGTVLVPGTYAAAVQAVGPVDSAWSAEATFTIAPPVPVAPTGFTVA